MSDTPLPDDVFRWPADPYALLGVSPHTNAKDAKRAYLKLARQFKPEHEPEKFQRLREAFEQVQQQISFRERYSEYFSAGQGPSSDGDAVVEQARPEETASTESLPGDGREPEEDLESLWDAACQGDEERAYAGFLRLRNQGHAHGDVCLRLYWLLTANPQLDSQRSPCDWLAAGLRATRLTGPLRELYRRELAASALEAIGPRCSELLDHAQSPGRLFDLLDWRWKGAGRLRHWRLIIEDLRRARSKIVFEEEVTWGRLLILAIEQLAFVDESEAFVVLNDLRRELDQLSYLHAMLGDDYDRLDLLFDVVAGWRSVREARDVPPFWSALVPLSWSPAVEAARESAAPLLKALASDPLRGLWTFDALAGHSKPVAAQLGQLIERLRHQYGPCEDRTDREAIEHTIHRFAQQNRSSYSECRERLLQFCIGEAIDPFWIGPILDENSAGLRAADESWTDLIADDGPLRYVYLGYRAYWG